MNRITVAALCAVAASPAFAAEPAKEAAPAMDMSKMGPGARKPSDEKKVKKEIEDFYKKEDEAAAKGDMNAMLERVDFPVYMATDDLKGKVEAKETSKDDYIKMMKPFYENMPKDSKTTHKPTITVLSDSLALVVDDFTMTTGKQKMTGKNGGLLVKIDGNWKWKAMVEAGWGGMEEPKAAAPAAKPAEPAKPAPAPGKK